MLPGDLLVGRVYRVNRMSSFKSTYKSGDRVVVAHIKPGRLYLPMRNSNRLMKLFKKAGGKLLKDIRSADGVKCKPSIKIRYGGMLNEGTKFKTPVFTHVDEDIGHGQNLDEVSSASEMEDDDDDVELTEEEEEELAERDTVDRAPRRTPNNNKKKNTTVVISDEEDNFFWGASSKTK